MKKQELKDRIYLLTGNTAPLSYMLASRHTKRHPLLYFDAEKHANRELRYARNQGSPFVDEQDDNAILEPIVFEDGALNVPKNNVALQQFLDYHPGNGIKFSERDEGKEATEELKFLNLVYAKNHPNEFLELLDNPKLKLQDFCNRLITGNFLNLRNNGREIFYNLKNNKKRLFTVPFGEEPVSALVAFFQSDDGLEAYEFFKKKVKD